jgi:hypothetical protein
MKRDDIIGKFGLHGNTMVHFEDLANELSPTNG